MSPVIPPAASLDNSRFVENNPAIYGRDLWPAIFQSNAQPWMAGLLSSRRVATFYRCRHRCRFSKSVTALVTPPSISRRRSLERVSPTALTRMAASSVTGHSCSQMPQPMHNAGST